MSGITVLASETIMKINPLGSTLVMIGTSLMIFSLILLFIFQKSNIPIIVAAIGTCISLGALGWAHANKVEDYVQYSILIPDDANFKEIYEKYEILEVKGEIYEVKEIEVND